MSLMLMIQYAAIWGPGGVEPGLKKVKFSIGKTTSLVLLTTDATATILRLQLQLQLQLLTASRARAAVPMLRHCDRLAHTSTT